MGSIEEDAEWIGTKIFSLLNLKKRGQYFDLVILTGRMRQIFLPVAIIIGDII